MLSYLTDECVTGCKYGNHHALCGMLIPKLDYSLPDKFFNEYILSKKEELLIILPSFISKYNLTQKYKDFITRKRYNVFIIFAINKMYFSNIELANLLMVDIKLIEKSLKLNAERFEFMEPFEKELSELIN